MNSEAKTGLVVGLGVIVLIGVLLSNYLGAGGAPAHTAELPIGSAYRDRVMTPAVVPGAVRTEISNVNSGDVAAPGPAQVAGGNATGGDDGANNLVMGMAVTPIPAGQIPAVVPPSDGGSNVIQVADVRPIPVPVPVGGVVKPVAPAGDAYVIAPGDTLSKISKRFYHSANADDEQRIVAANPNVLKNIHTMLAAGKKLFIPAKVAVVPVGPAVTQPGPAVVAPAPQATHWYMVQSGDTLEKIGRKLAVANLGDFVKQVSALNQIKDSRSLQIGMKLKLPPSPASPSPALGLH